MTDVTTRPTIRVTLHHLNGNAADVVVHHFGAFVDFASLGHRTLRFWLRPGQGPGYVEPIHYDQYGEA